MNNGYGFLIFIGILILALTIGETYSQAAGWAALAIGFMAFGGVGAMVEYLGPDSSGK